MNQINFNLLRRFTKLPVRYICFVTLLFIGTTVHAKTYYISATGNDSNDGLTAATSWQTIVKINSAKFKRNDFILFKRGDTFYGGIVVRGNNLNFGAYGTGPKPVITGLSTVNGWVNLGGNIWEAPAANAKNGVNLVLRNGVIQQIGRYPNQDAENEGYITYTDASTNSITVPGLSPNINWTNAEVAIRHNRWDITKQKIKRHSGNKLTFITDEQERPRVNYGCFFQRDSKTLDEDGEWWHNEEDGKLRMYFASNNPNSFDIQIATIDTLFKNRHFNNLTIYDLAFDGSGKRGIWSNGGTGISIKNCEVFNSGAEAITCLFSVNVTIDNCTITNSLGSGIRVLNNDKKAANAVVKNCEVKNTAYMAGMETSGNFNSGAGIACEKGDGITIQNNTITNSGYIGISWQGDNVSIKYNFINTFCTLRDDGGGIYSVENAGSNLPRRTNRKIIGNIVINGRGNNNGTNNPKGNSAKGLYFDLGTRSVLADSNTVANVVGGAFHGNNNTSLTITNNVFFNTNGYSSQRFADAPSVRNMTIKKNIIYPYRFEYRNLGINSPGITKEADIRAMGLIDSNYYSLRNGIDTSLITVTTKADGTGYLEDLYQFPSLDETFKIERNSIEVANTGKLEYNASNTPKVGTFSGLRKKDVFGKEYNNSVTIPAWRSVVLIPNGTAESVNKAPVANAGNMQTILLPENTVTLNGKGTDTDGTILKYSWTKISGPQNGSIESPLSASTILSNLRAGVYKYELMVTDNDDATGKDTVQINVNSDLLPAVDPSNTVNGLDYKYYEGAWMELPAFSTLSADGSGTVLNFDLSPAKIRKGFGFNFTGFVNVPIDGYYTFYTTSDDGSKLLIDNVLTVSNDGIHGITEKSGIIGLMAGKHAISGLFFQRGGGSRFIVSYESDEISKKPISPSDLYRMNISTPAKVPTTSSRTAVGPTQNIDVINSINSLKINISPNPFSSTFDLFVQGKNTDKIAISALDMFGKTIFKTEGVANKHYVLGSNFPGGIYVINVIQGNNIQTFKVVKQ